MARDNQIFGSFDGCSDNRTCRRHRLEDCVGMPSQSEVWTRIFADFNKPGMSSTLGLSSGLFLAIEGARRVGSITTRVADHRLPMQRTS